MNDCLTEPDNKCVHVCPSGRHIVAVHTKDDSFEECDRIEHDRVCAECDWHSTGIDHIRGYIR